MSDSITPDGGQPIAALVVTVSVDVDPGRGTVRVEGELDIATVDRLTKVLEDQLARGCRHVALDVSALRFCGATGLGAVIAARRRYRAAGGDLVVTGASGRMLRLLQATGLEDLQAPDV
ncbi:MAG TPA: STAS domain-containing protein [Mycobacteriales bacterium]|jgi:anti-anti-sigma factor|nr:STAS domain-containing protein [Mycobacteriales bacterium]